MSEIQFNANLKKAENAEPTDWAAIRSTGTKRAYLRSRLNIIAIAQLQDNSALNCLHKINVLGGTLRKLTER